MAKLSLPHERRKAQLKSAKLRSQVTIAEQRERLTRINQELKAMAPKRPKKEVV
jgi:hypothetical protein